MRREPFHALQDQAADAERERRLGLLLRRMPGWMRKAIMWLRRPQAYWVRIPAGVLLILGSVLRGHPETNESSSMRLSRSRIPVA